MERRFLGNLSNAYWRRIYSEALRLRKRGYTLEWIGLNYRIYRNRVLPHLKVAIFDAERLVKHHNPVETFIPEGTGTIERYAYTYPFDPTTPTFSEEKYFGAEYYTAVGQEYWAGFDFLRIMPNANGTYQMWEGVYPTGLLHYQAIDEYPPDKDASYVYDKVIGIEDRDSYFFQNVPLEGYTWNRLHLYALPKVILNGGTFRRMNLFVISAGVISVSSWFTVTQTTYLYYIDNPWFTDPATGARWTSQAINAVEAGFTAGLGNVAETRCTHFRIEAWYNRYGMYRGFISFDTSPLAGATVLSAILRLAVSADFSLTDFDCHVYSGMDQWTTAEDMDWTDCPTYEGIIFNTANIVVDTYYELAIAATSVNTVGKTQFKLVSGNEDTEPTQDEFVSMHATEPYPPQLEVTYMVVVVPRLTGNGLTQTICVG